MCLSAVACDKAPRAPEAARGPSASEPVASPSYQPSLYDLDAAELAAVKEYLKPTAGELRETTEDGDLLPVFRVAKVDLNGDAIREVLLRIEGGYFCGSGGCGLDVLKMENGKYRKVSHSTLTFLPIGSVDSKTNGWDDLIVTVRRDYIPSGAARLMFDGKRYSSNPTMPPAVPTDRGFFVVLLSETSQTYPLLD